MAFFGGVNLAPIGIVIFWMYVHFKRERIFARNLEILSYYL